MSISVGFLRAVACAALSAGGPADPPLVTLTPNQPVVRHIAKGQGDVLDADSVLLEYSIGEERSYLWGRAAYAAHRHVLVVADGVLHYVPFGVRPDPARPALPVVEGHEVVGLRPDLSEATVVLMTEVYQRSLRRWRWSDPYYWAAFQVQGEPH